MRWLIITLVLCSLVGCDTTQQYGLGCLPSDTSGMVRATIAIGAELPEYVNWQHFLPSVGNQGGAASCVGWTLAWGAMVRHSPSYVYNQRLVGSQGCTHDNGMTLSNGLAIIKRGSLPIEAWPYTPADLCTQPTGPQLSKAADYALQGYALLSSGSGNIDLEQIKAALASGYKVAIGVAVWSPPFYAPDQAGRVRVHKEGDAYYGGHALLLYGYAGNEFYAFNSWGVGWGNGGTCILTEGFMRTDVWEAWVLYEPWEEATPTPTVTATRTATRTALPEPTPTYPLPPTMPPQVTPTATPDADAVYHAEVWVWRMNGDARILVGVFPYPDCSLEDIEGMVGRSTTLR